MPTRTGQAAESLKTYLNDHLAGSQTALQLLDHLIGSVELEEREFLAALRREIQADRHTLEELQKRTGDSPSGLRQLGGWVAEKAARLKLLIDDPSRGTLAHLEALEMLGLGVLGKRALWRALAAAEIPAYIDVDFDRLAQRADDQHDRLEARRIASARRVLSERK